MTPARMQKAVAATVTGILVICIVCMFLVDPVLFVLTFCGLAVLWAFIIAGEALILRLRGRPQSESEIGPVRFRIAFCIVGAAMGGAGGGLIAYCISLL